MQNLLKNHDFILMEAAINERLRRADGIKLHPRLVNAPLIYDNKGKKILAELYQDYMSIAVAHDLPFFMCTPTWRTNLDRVKNSGFPLSINIDSVKFMKEIRDKAKLKRKIVKIGGLIGCKNDCYKPEEALSSDQAENFHSWQIDQLATAGVDFLIAQTLPEMGEAIGIAKAMEKTKLPYFISFVINRNGFILDGSPIDKAFKAIDDQTIHQPVGYLINCAYPTFLCAEKQAKMIFERLIGFLANASSLDHCDLDGSNDLKMDDVAEWGSEMLNLNNQFGLKILGGCCGTGAEHLTYLVKNRIQSSNHP